MMLFYIDPGTGSMLFTILIGLLGAAIYALRGLIMKSKMFWKGGKKNRKGGSREEIVFYTDSKRYWNIFKPLCDEMESRGQSVLYLTSSPDDPLLQEEYKHIRSEFIGEGNKAFVRMNFLRANVVLSSTPGLGVYQWKRSRDVDWYVHVLHAANDLTRYHMFGLDFYDAVFVSGEYQIKELLDLEKLWDLPAKEKILAGLPHMDMLYKRLQEAGPAAGHPTTVLLAPSWGNSGIFRVYGERIIDRLIETQYHVIIRPHPQSLESEKELIGGLREKYPDSEQLEWNFDNDNFDVLNRSDVMISDYSGVMYEFTLIFGKPLIYADVSYDLEPYDAGWLEEKPWTFRSLKYLGIQLNAENLDRIKETIDYCLSAPELKEGIIRAREETWVNIGQSVRIISDYLIRKKEELLSESQEAEAAEEIPAAE